MDCKNNANHKSPACRLSPPKTCMHCGAEFRQTVGTRRKGLYCSRKCAAQENFVKKRLKREEDSALSVGFLIWFSRWLLCVDCGTWYWGSRGGLRGTSPIRCQSCNQLHEECRRHGYFNNDTKQCQLMIPCHRCGKAFHKTNGKCRTCEECKYAAKRQATHNNRLNRKQALKCVRREKYCVAEVFQYDEYVCYICGEATDRHLDSNDILYPTIDHIIPVSRGGPDIRANVRCCCRKCNSDKRDMTYEEFMKYLDDLDDERADHG